MANPDFSKKAYTQADLQFIRDNYLTMTDEQIGAVLGRSAAAISLRRSYMSLARQEVRPRKKKKPRKWVYHKSYIDNGMTNDLLVKVELLKRRNGTYASPKFSMGVK